MKRIIILFLTLLLVVGCSSGLKNQIKQSDLKGYWQQTERDWSGEIDDMSDNPYAYLEIKDTKMYFYNENTENRGYYESVSEKYYILEGNQLYYDYYELKGKEWKENINELYGGIYTVSLDDDTLILIKYYGETEEEGYDKATYKKMEDDFLLLPQ